MLFLALSAGCGAHDDGTMTNGPIDLEAALATFDDVWAPRIITQINNYDVRVGKVAGEFVWHSHDNTDELFMVLDGELRIALHDDEHVVVLPKGSIFVVPRGVVHKTFSIEGASILMFEPTGTSNTGDRHDEIPSHINSTTGHALMNKAEEVSPAG
jgi:mannose-6-phosphate isomerase-like protein (cupin superfamily)